MGKYLRDNIWRLLFSVVMGMLFGVVGCTVLNLVLGCIFAFVASVYFYIMI